MSGNGASDNPATGELLLPLNPLIGRTAELAELLALLGNREVRLLTLTGPAGVGKTHLALQAAHDAAAHFLDGVHFVPLAALADPSLVMSTLARHLGSPDDGHPRLERLRALLAGRRLLVVLDNFEHVLPAASELADFLRACPGVAALVTSRAALRVGGEQIFPTHPFALPADDHRWTAADLDRVPALRLFVARAKQADPRFEPSPVELPVIAEVCRLLDGLPLAIELAAARIPVLPLPRLAERLSAMAPGALPLLTEGPVDAPPRLKSVQDAVAWSYDLLSESHRALFRRLSIFVGGFTLEAAETLAAGRSEGAGYPLDAGRDPKVRWWEHVGRDIADRDRESWQTPALPPLDLDPVSGVGELLRQSLLRAAADAGTPLGREARFVMLETIRAYGLEQLRREGEEAETRAAHAAWALAFAEVAGAKLWDPDQAIWAAKIEAELNNLRAAFSWAENQGAAGIEIILRMGAALSLYWQTRGLVAEGRAWLETALARSGGPAWDRAVALNVVGQLAWTQQDLDRAESALSEALAFWQPTGNKLHTARSLQFLGLVAWARGDIPKMVELTEQARQLYVAWSGNIGIGTCSLVLAIVAAGAGEYDRARALLKEASERCAIEGFDWGVAAATLNAGEIERKLGNLPAAVAHYGDALRSFAAMGDPWGIGGTIAGIAAAGVAADRTIQATRLFGASAALLERATAFLPAATTQTTEQALSTAQRVLGSRFEEVVNSGRSMPMAAAIAEANRLATFVRAGPGSQGSGEVIAGQRLPPHLAETLRLVVTGRTDPEIAKILGIGVRTIEKNVSNLLSIYGVNRRGELIAEIARADPTVLDTL
jgi:non-specific serine/threonine protein kinase